MFYKFVSPAHLVFAQKQSVQNQKWAKHNVSPILAAIFAAYLICGGLGGLKPRQKLIHMPFKSVRLFGEVIDRPIDPDGRITGYFCAPLNPNH